jgi:anti-anti-sigma factor
MTASRLMIQDFAGVTVVTLSDSSIIDAAIIDSIGRELYALVDVQNKRQMVLDFTNVKTLSSHSLGVLLTLKKKIAEIKGVLALCAVRKEITKIFSLTGLDKQFTFFPDDAAALQSFGVRVK